MSGHELPPWDQVAVLLGDHKWHVQGTWQARVRDTCQVYGRLGSQDVDLLRDCGLHGMWHGAAGRDWTCRVC